MEQMKTIENKSSTRFNRILYGMFILLAIYQSVISLNFIEAATAMGIALIFDPFNPQQPWNERPIWQRVWLILHLAIAAGLLGFAMGWND